MTDKIYRSFKFKLYIEPEHDLLFRRWAGVCRAVYNAALEQRLNHWRAFKRVEGKSISYFTQARELTALRAEFNWIKDCPYCAQQQALRDLDKAYSNFFKGLADYPTPRRKGINESFRFSKTDCGDVEILNGKWARVRLPKVGLVKFRLTRPIRGTLKNITINDGFIVFACEIEHSAPDIIPGGEVGIDRGISNNVALSTGELMSMDRAGIKAIEERHKDVQRQVARRKRGSRRWVKAKRHAASLKAKAARKRLHWQHEVTTAIAKRNGLVVLEDLKISNMSKSASGTVAEPGRMVPQKAGLNREIKNAAWFQFERLLTYKVKERGGVVLKINPAYTSQTCACCGSVNRKNRESQAKFACIDCGFEDHADINAAVNILRAGTQPATVKVAK